LEPPLIGITAGDDPKNPGAYVLRWDYIRSVERAGGVPVVLAPSGATLHPVLIDRLDGLVLTGGMDIDPAVYGEKPHPTTSRMSHERDEFEFMLTQSALIRNLPILAICRGLQILNVVQGGSLIQDIPEMIGTKIVHNDPNRPRSEIAHDVTLQLKSKLQRILDTDRLPVNSFHHQCVKKLGKDLVATAWSDDGAIEAIEMPNAQFIIGVQWHPESFWNINSAFTPLFNQFLSVASRHRC
jgi:putative glutamine amidotransferase